MAQTIRRIVARTSIPIPIITMTTNVSRIYSPDLFSENESILLDADRARSYGISLPRIAALTFLSVRANWRESLDVHAASCVNEAIAFLMSGCGDARYRLWLFVADGPWRLASRLTSYNKLWTARRDLADAPYALRRGEEVEFRDGQFCRYAGFLEISPNGCEAAIQSVRQNSSFSMVFSNRPLESVENVKSAFHSAFPMEGEMRATSIDWLSLVMGLCPKGDILFRVTGQFDDREAAVDLIAQTDVLSTFGALD
jgi:hypothetical protein